MILFFLGCTAPLPVTSAPDASSPVTPAPASDACSREPGFDQWPGDRRMRLEVGDLVPGSVVTLAVSGAVPGEEVTVQLGDLCALDCPPERDGACFQPVAPVVLGSAPADAAGAVLLSVPVEVEWEGRWLVLQATSTDTLSQAVVDRVLVEGWLESPFPGEVDWISPVTLRHQGSAGDLFTLDLAPGRRVRVDLLGMGQYGQPSVWTTADGSVTRLVPTGDATHYAFDAWSPGPSNLAIDAAFYNWGGIYELDITTAPLGTAVDWYPDHDGDGYGDLLGPPVSSVVPVAFASPDARDCDDDDPLVHPNAAETCGDSRDQDCDASDRACSPDPGGTTVLEAGTRASGEAGTHAGEWLAHGDLDGDGVVELVAGGWEGFARPLSRTDALPPSGLLIPWAATGAVGDLTGDGQDDLTLLSLTEPVFTVYPGPLLGAPDPSNAIEVVRPRPTVRGAAIGDATGDGVSDLLVIGQTELAVFAGPLTGTPAVDRQVPARSLARPAAAFGDADGDGIEDVWTQDVCLYLSPVGSVEEGCVDDGEDDNLALAGLTSLDANGDGLADVGVGGEDGAYVFLGPLSGDSSVADGAWFTALEPGFRNWANSTLVPDRDGDGAAELVLVSVDGIANSGEAWMVSVAGGGVVERSAGTTIWSGATLPSLLGADLDGDGSGDLALGDPNAAAGSDWGAGVVYLSWGP